MKLITAIVKPFTLPEIRQALEQQEVRGLTVTESQGFGQQRGHSEVYRGAEYATDFVPKVKLEVVAADDHAEDIINAIVDAAYTGKIGDGKLWVTPVEDAFGLRPGEPGAAALKNPLAYRPTVPRRAPAPAASCIAQPRAPSGDCARCHRVLRPQ